MKTYIYARKFAAALMEVSDHPKQLVDELECIAESWSLLNDFIPMYISDKEKHARLEQLGLSAIEQKLILELSRSGMMRLLPNITQQCAYLKNQNDHKVVAKVTSKRQLTQLEQEALIQALSNRHQKDVHLESEVDSDVIDGLRVEVDYHVFDDTVATKLDLLVQKLSYEMEGV